MCAAAMVLESRDSALTGAEVDFDRNVADQSGARYPHRLQIDEAEAGKALLAKLVGVAEQLVAAANGEDRGIARHGSGERLALRLDHVGGNRPLVAVLAAAGVDEGGVGGVE